MANRTVAFTRIAALLILPTLVWSGVAYEARQPIKAAAHQVVMAAKDIRAAIEKPA